MSGIIWLASYPKSGNTWLRVFLTNLQRDADEPASINDLESTPIASAREIFDDNVGIEASDLTAYEIDRLRPELYRRLAETTTEPLYMKIHDAYTEATPNHPLIPATATAGAIYLVRNPLDVAISNAHHHGTSYDTAINCMADINAALNYASDRLLFQLPQKLLSWSGHVLSWADSAPFPVCLLRYEDMKTTPVEAFTRAVRFMGLDRSTAQIEKAIRFSAFDILQGQEKAGGFQEKSTVATRFFRKGQSGSWREELTKAQVQRIVADHREVMQRFGYLDKDGEIVA